MTNKRVTLIGAGNVAHHLAPALLKAGINLCQIYSRSVESARELGIKTGITYTSEVYAVYPDCDIYIFCISDDALLSFFKSIKVNKDALILHTSGSLPMDIFAPFTKHYGVLYPLQTFTKKRDLDFKEIPLCIEGASGATLKEIKQLAGLLSYRVQEVNTEKRKYLHLSAVFANNFTNHLYTIAGKILEEEGLEFDLLRPLIFETAHKVMLMQPELAQTGPARRKDDNILNIQKAMLKDKKKWLQIYTLFSNSIKEEIIKNEPKVETENKPQMPTLW